MKNQLKTLKMTRNDLEMTLNDLQMTLRSKTNTLLCCPWKNLQKLSWFLSSNSYNIFLLMKDLFLDVWTVTRPFNMVLTSRKNHTIIFLVDNWILVNNQQ